MFLKERAPRQPIALHGVRVGHEPSTEVVPRDQKDRNERENGQRKQRTEHKHRHQREADRQDHAQDCGQKVGSKIETFSIGSLSGYITLPTGMFS